MTLPMTPPSFILAGKLSGVCRGGRQPPLPGVRGQGPRRVGAAGDDTTETTAPGALSQP